jgi:hypothetical protein
MHKNFAKEYDGVCDEENKVFNEHFLYFLFFDFYIVYVFY